jgi:uncharacterized protein (DUF1697 family)
MSALRDVLGQLGFADARSTLQSGNLVFRSRDRSRGRLERLLERECSERLALETDVFVRTEAEWKAIVAANPFGDEADNAPGHLLVVFLKRAPSSNEIEALRSANEGPEIVRAVGTELFIVCPNGIGRSRLTSALVEQKLQTRGTGRNWRTVLRLATLAGAS